MAPLLAVLLAALPPPDWREELVVSVWTAIDAQIDAACRWSGPVGASLPLSCDHARLLAAVREAERFEAEVTPDARLRYLIGLAWRHAGEPAKAEAALREATALDPQRPEAWSDLGELLVAREAWSDADEAFAHVVRLVPDGPGAWVGHLQRAQVAAWRADPAAFEAHLRAALDHGLDLSVVAHQPAWRGFYQQPALRPILERMVGLHAPPGVLESLRAP